MEEKARLLLETRARDLARPRKREEEDGEGIDLVLFQLGKEHFGVETRFVRETLRFKEFLPLPGTPDYLLGIIHLRGRIVSLADLIDDTPVAAREPGYLLLLGDGAMEFALAVDRVEAEQRFPARAIQPPPEAFSGPRKELLLGMTEEGIVLLDGERLLRDPAMTLDQSNPRNLS